LTQADEAHHSPANTWQVAIDYFASAKVVKVTGTPFRSDNQQITGKLVYKYKLSQAMANNYVKSLENIHYVPDELKLTIDGNESKLYTLDEVYDLLGKDEDWVSRSVAYSDECSRKIIDLSISLLEKKKANSEVPHKIIAVACSIEHAKKIQDLYIEKGMRTTIVHSDLEKRIVESNLSDIKNDRVDVIINVSMLGEGYDHPYLSIAAIFRPFRHPLPYAQFIGRILRYISPENHNLTLTDNIGQIISHKYLYMDKLWQFYREQINECDTIKSLMDINIEEIVDDIDHQVNDENTRAYDISFGNAKELGGGKTIAEIYLDTELTKAARDKDLEDEKKAIELAKLLDTTVEDALRVLKQREFAKNNIYKRPELLAREMRKDIDSLIREQYVPELLNEFEIDHKGTGLKNLPFLRSREYSWIAKNDTYKNDALLAIYFNTSLRNFINKNRKEWNNDDLEHAYDYLTSNLYPFVKKALASLKDLS